MAVVENTTTTNFKQIITFLCREVQDGLKYTKCLFQTIFFRNSSIASKIPTAFCKLFKSHTPQNLEATCFRIFDRTKEGVHQNKWHSVSDSSKEKGWEGLKICHQQISDFLAKEVPNGLKIYQNTVSNSITGDLPWSRSYFEKERIFTWDDVRSCNLNFLVQRDNLHFMFNLFQFLLFTDHFLFLWAPPRQIS